MVSFVRVQGLLWADIVAKYAIWELMTYLTDIWNLDIVHAAIIINVFLTFSEIMPTGLIFLVDAFMGHYRMLLLSSIALCFGLGLLALSTVLKGDCADSDPDCIGVGDTRKSLFYTALCLIAFGLSGHTTSLESFYDIQVQIQVQAKCESNMMEVKLHLQLLCIFCMRIFPIIAGVAVPSIYSWPLQYGIPAICTFIATMFFVSGSRSYTHVEPEGSPFTTLFRVYVAATSKLFYRTPRTTELHKIDDEGVHNLPHTRGLRWLDKAAIILPTPTLEQQQRDRWSLCSVNEVEETKLSIRLIPMWLPFIMCGVVSATGSTFFIQQAYEMNPRVGKLKVPLTIFLFFKQMAKYVFDKFFVQISERMGKCAPLIGFVIAMALSILCCITAAKVESRRLKPDERTTMNVFWLLPQFLLLGALDGYSIVFFLYDKIPASFRCYSHLLSRAVDGLGVIGSSLTVYVVRQVSEKGNKTNWFQETLNESRLDKYYWTLAVMSAINFGFLILADLWYKHQDSHNQDIPVSVIEEEEHAQHNADNA